MDFPITKKSLYFTSIISLLILGPYVFLHFRYGFFEKGFYFGFLPLTNLILVWHVLTAEFTKPGNLDAYSTDSFDLIWKDRWSKHDKKTNLPLVAWMFGIYTIGLLLIFLFRNRLIGHVSYILIMMIITYGYIIWTGFAIMVTILYFTKESPSAEIIVYDKGIQYIKNFFEWKNIQSIYTPTHFKITYRVSSIYRKGAQNLHTIKLLTKERDTYILNILDLAGFKNSLKKIGQVHLFNDN